MHNGIWLLLAIAVSYALALVAVLLIRLRGGLVLAAVCLSTPVILSAPLLIPSSAIIFRAASACISADLMFRLVDLFRHQRGLKDAITLRDGFRFLVPFPIFLVVFTDRQRRPDHIA